MCSMKQLIALVIVIFVCSSVFPQATGPKISAKTLNQIGQNARDIEKINEVIASYEEFTNSLKEQFGSLNLAGLKDTITNQSRYIDTIFQILEASNLKISVTADSLSTTTYTIVSLIDDTNKKFEGIENTADQNFLYTIAGLAAVALLALILFIIVFIRMGRHNKKSKALFTEIKTKVDEELEGMKKNLDTTLSDTKRSLDGKIRITDTTLSRRLTESSEIFEQKLNDTKGSLDNELKSSSEKLQSQVSEIQNTFKSELSNIQKLLDSKITETNKIIEEHITSAKEILDKISGEED